MRFHRKSQNLQGATPEGRRPHGAIWAALGPRGEEKASRRWAQCPRHLRRSEGPQPWWADALQELVDKDRARPGPRPAPGSRATMVWPLAYHFPSRVGDPYHAQRGHPVRNTLPFIDPCPRYTVPMTQPVPAPGPGAVPQVRQLLPWRSGRSDSPLPRQPPLSL